MTKRITLGPFQGIDNVHRDTARPFQIPNWKEKRNTALVRATNVDINDDGWTKSRLPITRTHILLDGQGAWEIDERLFYQDGDKLYEYDAATPLELLAGLNTRVSMCSHAGLIYITDGVKHWELDGAQTRPWGLPVPTLSLASGAGDLPSGIYMVQAAFVDAIGNEGGTSVLGSIYLPAGGGISIDVSNSAEQFAVNLYVSSAGQAHTSYVDAVAVANLPYVFAGPAVTVADPPKTEQMIGPIPNAAGVCSYRAFILMWRDNVVFRSEGLEPHIFHPDNIMQFESAVTACVGINKGVWIGTATGLWWVTGEDSDGWIPIRKTRDAVVRGSLVIPGTKLPRLETDEPVVLFLTDRGLVACTSSGRVVHILDNVYEFPPTSRASFAYTEHTGTHQILVALED